MQAIISPKNWGTTAVLSTSWLHFNSLSYNESEKMKNETSAATDDDSIVLAHGACVTKPEYDITELTES